MIGDEVMFVVQSPVNVARIGLSLAEAYAGDELISDVRVALAIGPTLLQEGRLLRPGGEPGQPSGGRRPSGDRAHLGRAPLDELVEQRGPTSRVRGRSGPGTLKDLGRVQAWKLSGREASPGADRRRNVRWERLFGGAEPSSTRFVIEASDSLSSGLGSGGSPAPPRVTELLRANQSPSSRAVAMAKSPRVNRPSKGELRPPS